MAASVIKWGVVISMVCGSLAIRAETAPTLTHPTIHFESDSTEVVSEDAPKLDEDVAWLAKFPKAVVILEGHCDQTGDSEYNMELGDRRAREIKSYLIGHGIASDRVIMVVSFGDKRPLDPSETRVALQKNRRVEVVLR